MGFDPIFLHTARHIKNTRAILLSSKGSSCKGQSGDAHLKDIFYDWKYFTCHLFDIWMVKNVDKNMIQSKIFEMITRYW